jgi:Flp pilus assembly CpaE family ATPase
VPVPEERIRVVLNVTSPEMDVSPRSLEEALGRPIFWTVPYDRNVRRSTQLGRSVVEAQANSPAAASFVELAQVISGAPPAPRRSGLLARLLGRPDDVGVASERWQEAVS